MFNEELADERGLTGEEKNALVALYQSMETVLNKPYEVCSSPKDVSRYIQSLEYEMQELWKFDTDSDFHSYWFLVKGCQCPKLDNKDLIGSRMSYIDASCPYHGSQKATSWEFIDP